MRDLRRQVAAVAALKHELREAVVRARRGGLSRELGHSVMPGRGVRVDRAVRVAAAGARAGAAARRRGRGHTAAGARPVVLPARLDCVHLGLPARLVLLFHLVPVGFAHATVVSVLSLVAIPWALVALALSLVVARCALVFSAAVPLGVAWTVVSRGVRPLHLEARVHVRGGDQLARRDRRRPRARGCRRVRLVRRGVGEDEQVGVIVLVEQLWLDPSLVLQQLQVVLLDAPEVGLGHVRLVVQRHLVHDQPTRRGRARLHGVAHGHAEREMLYFAWGLARVLSIYSRARGQARHEP